MGLSEFLVYLGGVGVVAVISWLFEDFVWFQALTGKIKQVVFFAACAVVAIAAQLSIVYIPADVITAVAPYFATLSAIFAYVFLGSDFHDKTKIE
jgi:hypothetical protein